MHTSLQLAACAIVRFLMNNNSSYVGPGWALIEASTGANRQVPSNTGSITSLTTAAAWVSGTIETGSWVVLESRNANNSNHFQLYIEYNSTTQLNFMLMPFSNFVTGGVATSPPTFPSGSSGSFGESTGTINQCTLLSSAGSRYYSVIADEGMMSLIVDGNDSTDLRWTYIGELNTVRTGSDPRSYVLWDLEANAFVGNSTNQNGFNRLSPVDNLTGLQTGWMTYPYSFAFTMSPHDMGSATTAARGNPYGFDYLLPIGVFFNDSNHRHFSGWMRNVYSVFAGLGIRGTLNNRRYLHINNDNVNAPPSLCFVWDGVTRY